MNFSKFGRGSCGYDTDSYVLCGCHTDLLQIVAAFRKVASFHKVVILKPVLVTLRTKFFVLSLPFFLGPGLKVNGKPLYGDACVLLQLTFFMVFKYIKVVSCEKGTDNSPATVKS